MTSLDFKALLAKERAAMLQGNGAKSRSKRQDDEEELVLGAKAPLDWTRHTVPADVEGVTYVSGTSYV